MGDYEKPKKRVRRVHSRRNPETARCVLCVSGGKEVGHTPILTTQRLHRVQWCARGGLKLLHLWHTRS